MAALRLARATGDPLALSTALIVPAIICSRLGLYDAAVELAEQAVVQARLSGDVEAIAQCISNFGSLHADYLYRFAVVSPEERYSYLQTAIEHSRIAAVLARDHADGEMQRLPGYNLVEFLLLAGDRLAAEEAMRDTDAAAGEPSKRSLVQRGHVHALLLLEQGDRAHAIAALQESIERCIAYPSLELAVFSCHRLSQVLEEEGDFQAAYSAHARFHELFCRHTNEDASRHMQYSILHDKIEEMRSLVAEEEGRSSRLEAQNMKLVEETERFARETLEDALTGVGNRRRLDAVLAELSESRPRYAIAIADVDHFKLVNDRYSHVTGDLVLQTIAWLMRGIVMDPEEEGNLVARMGGEEFAIVLLKRSAVYGREICEKIRSAVQTYDWEGLAPGLSVTISLGLTFSQEGKDAAECLSISDKRLYDGKRAGRNRVVSSDRQRYMRALADSQAICDRVMFPYARMCHTSASGLRGNPRSGMRVRRKPL
ncbi:diguanylate cyclase [Acidisoma sp. S159]|uniref:GGDEF domain-containing protein n=1 Tax=Acidisoma sp. S159 TaxID=1747225 RepID=UPI00131C463B|nr:GGDEF domain-containing protein [Acidisoma sp. S159]